MEKFEKTRWGALAAALMICVAAGFGYAWSVLQNPIASAFGWPDGRVSLAYTVTVVCSTMAPLGFGGVLKRLGTRRCVAVGAVLFGGGLILTGSMTALWQLYFFYGVLNGLGVGFIYPTLMAYVVRLFPDKPGMASGLGTAAYGSGAVLWAPTAVALMEKLSLKGAFRVLGVGFLAVILLGAIFLLEPPEEFSRRFAAKAGGGSERDLTRGQMVRRGSFYLMVAVFTFALVAGSMVISQASPIAQQLLGCTAGEAAALVSVFSLCNVAGRFAFGGLSDKIGLEKAVTVLFVLCMMAMAALALTPWAGAAPAAMGVAAGCYGGFAAVLTPLTAKMFGRTHITENYGVMYVVFGLAALIGPNLAVSFKNAAGGSYTGAFLTAAVLAAVGLILSRFLKSKAS